MKPSTFFYNIGQGFKGVFRNSVMTTASVLVLVACMVLVGTFYIVIDTININIEQINDLNTIEIMLSKTYSDEQKEQIRSALEIIRQSSPIVDEEVRYISADEHLQKMKEMYPNSTWIYNIVPNSEYEEDSDTDVIDNPLRDSFQLHFSNLADTDAVKQVRHKIDSITVTDANGNEIDAVPTADIKDYIDLYGNVVSVKNTLYVVGLWLLAILLLLSLFVIMNTIKLGVFARRNEITFMRLCGATKSMIRMPFIVEGVIIGVFSAAVSFGIEFYLCEYLLKDIAGSAMSSASGGELIFPAFTDYMLIIGLGYLAIGLFAGIVSSSVSLKKYLKA
ncbi:MAG: permease-like cell division protein FtsX [Clostridia bacterium]|nr:permease-like cell division protein FtsX [Clostridia bacterium]